MENNSLLILKLLDDKKQLTEKLSNLLYGSIEYRERESKKYIYVHYREGGLTKTKYAGEYRDELVQLISGNNLIAREMKAKLRKISRSLIEYEYIETTLSLAVKRCIDFARKNLVLTIYKQGVLEGIAATYADTEKIVEGGKVNNVSADDVLKVINLKHAWDFILDENVIGFPSDYSVLTTINRLIEEGFYYYAGVLRSTPVAIGGSSYRPPLPIESDVKDNLTRIVSNKHNFVDAAVDALLYVMKAQLFLDGNKRTAIIFANHILISRGLGIIAIPDDKVSTYKKLLVDFYEGQDESIIRSFLISECFIKI